MPVTKKTAYRKHISILAVTLLLLLSMVRIRIIVSEDEPEVLNASGVVNRKIAVDPSELNDGYSAILYNNQNGLPTSEANAITETEEGFIWIGSYSGLVRYDGNSFVRLNSTTGISSVISLYADKKNRLWIGTNDAGLAVMEQDEFHQWGEKEGLKSLRIGAIAEDDQGIVYTATPTGVAMIDLDKNLRYVNDVRINGEYIQNIRIGSDNTLYGVTVDGDIFSAKNGYLVEFLDHETSGFKALNHVLPDPENPGYIYLSSDESEIYYGNLEYGLMDMKTWDISPISSVASMEYIDGELWFCAQNGIGKLTKDGVKIMQDLPMNNSIEKIMTDYEGNLWFTSSRQGVMKIVPNQFSNLFDRYGLPITVVNTTCKYKDQLFIGSDTGLMVVDDEGPVSSIPLTKAVTASGVDLETDDLLKYLEGKRIRSISRDSKGRLWIATWASVGMLVYDDDQLIAFTDADGLMSNRIRASHEMEDGTMLVTNTGGVSLIRNDSVVRSYNKNDGIDVAESLCVTEGFNGEIVLGSNGGGIYIIDETGTRNISIKDGMTSGIVMRIRTDAQRKVYWIVTSNSFAYMDEDFNVHTINDFPYSNNYDLYENKDGEIWVLASNGIYVTAADELLANGELSPVYYGLGNGMPGIATANSYSELTDDGDLYIAASSGVIRVNINNSYEGTSDLKVAVPFVEIDGKRLYPDEDGVFLIPADTDKLTVNGFVYNYSLIDPQVSYQLEGFEKESTTIRRSEMVPIDYTNLHGGTYYFNIKLMDSIGRVVKDVSVKIIKERAFYEEPLFYILSGLGVLALMVSIIQLAIRSRTRALEKKHQEAHELFEQTAEALANAIDAKDTYTNGHSRRVAEYSLKIAKEAGKSEEECEKVYFAALLHDVGKIGVPIEILSKKGRLTDEEFEYIKQHPVIGGQILSNIKQSPWLAEGARYHHERYNGKGYPEGLKGEEIPEIARIIAVADAYDAMTSNRSYRSAIPQHIVREELVKGIGTQFDPEFAKIMIHMLDLDSEYRMKEAQTGFYFPPDNDLRCDSIYNECSQGIGIMNKEATIRMYNRPDKSVPADQSLPTLILFDSLDGIVHPGEENNKDLLYYEYARIRMDGIVSGEGIRKYEVRFKDETDLTRQDFAEPENEDRYEVKAVRYKDHALIRLIDEVKTCEITIALPDSSRFLYISVSGENCYIHNIMVEVQEKEIPSDYITRIAEEISFIKDCPRGDIDNIQVDGWRTQTSEGIPVDGDMELSFHTMSLPTARLVWHCPFMCVYSSKDGKVDGEDFNEYLLLRLDGENWETDEHAENKVTVNRSPDFMGWDAWMARNKEGLDCKVAVHREGNTITINTENLGLAIETVTSIRDDIKDVYIALTGDQCAISDIRITRKDEKEEKEL